MEEDYAAASLERRSDVRALVEARRDLAALYMVGYVAECRLKALLRTRKRPFPRSGGQGHNLRALWKEAGFKLRDAGDEGATFLAEWTTSLRYEAITPAQLDHERLMKGANAACDLVARRHRAEELEAKRRRRRGTR
jgi:hypothetical protein